MGKSAEHEDMHTFVALSPTTHGRSDHHVTAIRASDNSNLASVIIYR